MSCVRPLTAYWRSPVRGSITFDRVQSATKIPFKLPCGRCIGCRLEKARQWGIRCMHEAKMWPRNSYVTLTYKDMPVGNSLQLTDLQLFMKKLRERRDRAGKGKVRFFAGGEYGEENKRPHYHLLLFNCDFPDMRFLTKNKRGEDLFSSKELEEIWPQGFNTIGAVTFDSCVYCAKYALKKISGDRAAEHYSWYDEDGVCYERRPEFAVMSLKPGIGSGYYERFGAEVRDHDSVVVNGREVRPPRFYDVRSESLDESLFLQHKRKRKRLAVLNRADNTDERLRVKERLMEIAAEKKERKL